MWGLEKGFVFFNKSFQLNACECVWQTTNYVKVYIEALESVGCVGFGGLFRATCCVDEGILKGLCTFSFFFFESGSRTLRLKNSNEGRWFCLVKWKHVVPCTNLSTAKSLKYIIPCMKLWTIKSILVYGTIGHSTSRQSWNLMWVTLIVNLEKLIGLHR